MNTSFFAITLLPFSVATTVEVVPPALADACEAWQPVEATLALWRPLIETAHRPLPLQIAGAVLLAASHEQAALSLLTSWQPLRAQGAAHSVPWPQEVLDELTQARDHWVTVSYWLAHLCARSDEHALFLECIPVAPDLGPLFAEALAQVRRLMGLLVCLADRRDSDHRWRGFTSASGRQELRPVLVYAPHDPASR